MDTAREMVQDLIAGRWRSQMIHSGVKLGIFDALNATPRSAAEVATGLGLDPARTYRLMRGLASLGVVKEHTERAFSLTEAGQFLRRDHPRSLAVTTLFEEGAELYRAWRHLPDIVRDGGPDGFRREFGQPVFDYVRRNEEFGARFHDAMSDYSAGELEMLKDALAECDLSSIRHLCDVGGGQGLLLCALLEKLPAARGTVYDLEEVIGQPGPKWAEKLGLEGRCEHVAGDMFETAPAADGYLLKHILHDWNDEECVRILSNLSRAAVPGARLFVAEFPVPANGKPHLAKLFDVHMLCVTSGRERTVEEYAALFLESGWTHERTWLPQAGPMGVIEARLR